MRDLELSGQVIRVDDEGFVCLTDLWKASGADPKNKPAEFLRNENTKRFIESLNVKVGYPTLRIVRGGKNSGSWSDKLICYKYAGFIDSDFEVGVYSILDKFFSGELTSESFNDRLQDWARRALLCENKGSFHGRGLSIHKKKKNQIHEEGEKLMDEIQIKITFDK